VGLPCKAELPCRCKCASCPLLHCPCAHQLPGAPLTAVTATPAPQPPPHRATHPSTTTPDPAANRGLAMCLPRPYAALAAGCAVRSSHPSQSLVPGSTLLRMRVLLKARLPLLRQSASPMQASFSVLSQRIHSFSTEPRPSAASCSARAGAREPLKCHEVRGIRCWACGVTRQQQHTNAYWHWHRPRVPAA
jgi:hypothetical protein